MKNVHAKVRYSCDLCQRTTSRQDYMKTHKMRHIGLKPFQCQICPVACYTNAELKVHVKSHHTAEGIKIRKKKEHHFGTWLASNGFDQVVRNQRVDLRCKEKTANWIELDFYIHRARDDVIFIVELDEHQHEGYSQMCETVRPFKIVEGLLEEIGTRPVCVVRINPDPFKVDGVKQKVDRKARYESFKRFYETFPTPDRQLSVQYMFYDTDANGELEIKSDPEFMACLNDVMLPPITT